MNNRFLNIECVFMDHLPSFVALHFLFGSAPSFDRVQHFLDEWYFPTIALIKIGQIFWENLSQSQQEENHTP